MHRKLQAILIPKHLLRDISCMSPDQQTYGLESCHGLIIHFAPQSTKFQRERTLVRQVARRTYCSFLPVFPFIANAVKMGMCLSGRCICCNGICLYLQELLYHWAIFFTHSQLIIKLGWLISVTEWFSGEGLL